MSSVNSPSDYRSAVLLLGPTGAGKSPLGEAIEQHGWRGRHCHHFDFGANMRQIVHAGCPDDWLTADDITFLYHVLVSGGLLEDEHLPLARRILQRFLYQRQVAAEDVVVLNGLPRHVGQAEGLADCLRVEQVIELRCAPETVLERLRRDTGGDRLGRTDDALELVRRKLALYSERTLPLLTFYRDLGVPVATVAVSADMTAEDMLARLHNA